MRMFRWTVLAVAAFTASGCAMMQQVKLEKASTFDSSRLSRVKKVAVVPVFHANSLSADDPSYKGKYHEGLPTANVYEGIKEAGRFEVVEMDKVITALKKLGWEGYPLEEGEDVSIMKAMFNPDKFRAGMTMQQGLKAAKMVGADAAVFGGFGLVGVGNSMKFVMSLRLVDIKTGKVLWGAARAEKMKISLLHPILSQQKQIRAMAATLIKEAS